ncbi:MAG: HEPN domain-containing protein [Bacteroidaceae bacterium]|nr:HEPN domain-containing protein [Bacteroidaceae bacterium]
MKTLTDEQRISIVRYRIENAQKTLAEVASHRDNGFYNTAVNRMYYACYYAASAILIANAIETKVVPHCQRVCTEYRFISRKMVGGLPEHFQ